MDYLKRLIGLAVLAVAVHVPDGATAESQIPPLDTAEMQSCVPAGVWLTPASGTRPSPPALMADLAKRPVVLLGETHDRSDHHLWQLQVISALHGRNPNMVMAFEAFPRSVQPALDKWLRGELDEKDFLKQTRWFDVWRFDPDLYMPLFHFARLNRIPMIAMNVDRNLIARIGQDGWAAIPTKDREGIGDPATPSGDYLDILAATYAGHDRTADPAKTVSRDDPDFQHFAEAQTVWDRAMAERLAEVRTAGGTPLVIGIVGRGHLEYGFGIPHQLRALGIPDSVHLLPWDGDRPCTDLKNTAGIAISDAVFGMAPFAHTTTPPPRLGVMIAPREGGGVTVTGVVEKSIAEAADIQKNDAIIAAAGQSVATTGELVAIIQAQAPGTWLPLTVVRGEKQISLVAKFPAPSTEAPSPP